MAKNHLTKAERQELGRRTQAVLRARIAEGSLPADYYARLGRKGFRVCLVKHGPEHLARILGDYYGRAIEARVLERNLARERERAATRRAYPLQGQACARCGAPARERDHAGAQGWRSGHEAIMLYCHRCHVDVEIGRIKNA